MAKRKRLQRHASTEVQGEGSWVVVAAQTVAEQREFRKLIKAKDADAFEIGVAALKSHVLEWNWVDDNDAPFPQPKDAPEIIEVLTDDEVSFLGKCIIGSETDAKN